MNDLKRALIFLLFINTVCSQYIYFGCYLDNDLKRDLNGTNYQDLSYNLTIEACAKFCYQNVFPYFGLQLKYIFKIHFLSKSL